MTKRFLLVAPLLFASLALAQPAIDINITPDDPISVPANGGWFDITVSIENTTTSPVSFDAWMDVTLPWMSSFTLYLPIPITLPAGYYSSHELAIYMPSFAPAGTYQLVAMVGDYPNTIWDQDQLTVIKAGSVGDGLATEGWICIGDLASKPEPIASPLDDPDIDINITPDDPITLPDSGGWFEVFVSIENTTTGPVSFEAWMDVTLPWWSSFTLYWPIPITLPGSYYAEAELNIWMPWFAPGGTYQLIAKVGDYPSSVIDSDTLTVIKEGFTGDGTGAEGWICLGSLEPNAIVANPALPERMTIAASPNPFNPSTMLNYQLPAASSVNLAVYDIHGRLAAQLVNGWRDAGSHQITFDGSGLASGTYIYRLMAGDQVQTGKLFLLK